MLFQDFGIEIRGRRWSVSSSYCHRFDRQHPHPSRAVLLIYCRGPSHTCWSIMIQLYRPGTSLDWHTDGHNYSNRIWSVELIKPQLGGDLEVKGPHKKWWRFHHFDGGLSSHQVTTCFGYRLVAMLQRGKPLKH